MEKPQENDECTDCEGRGHITRGIERNVSICSFCRGLGKIPAIGLGLCDRPYGGLLSQELCRVNRR